MAGVSAITNVSYVAPSGSTGSFQLTQGATGSVPVGSMLTFTLATQTGVDTWSVAFASDNVSLDVRLLQGQGRQALTTTLPLAQSTITLEIQAAGSNGGRDVVTAYITESITATGVATFSQGTITVANGLNSNIPTNGQSSIRLVGPTGAFSIGGFSNTGGAWSAGQPLTIENTTTQSMTIVYEDTSSTAVNRLDTQSGVNVVELPSKKSIDFVYDGTTNRFVLRHVGVVRPSVIHVQDFGAKVDGQLVTDGAITSGQNTLTCATSTPFKSSDVGKLITVRGAGSGGGTVTLATTIASYISASQVTLSANALHSANSAQVVFGTDDTSAVNSALSTANAGGNLVTSEVLFPLGICCVTGITLNYASASGLTLRGVCGPGASQRPSASSSTLMLMSSSAAALLNLSGTCHEIRDLWLHGNNLAPIVFEITYAGGPAISSRVQRCTFSGAVTNTGSLVSFTSQLEVANFNFYNCQFFQNPADGSDYAGYGVFNQNGNAFVCCFRECEFFFCANPVNFQAPDSGGIQLGGSNNFYQCEFYDYTDAIFKVEACEAFVVEDCYTEAGGTPFLKETNNHATLTCQSPIVISRCSCLTGGPAVLDLQGKQPIIVENSILGGNIKVSGVGPYRPLIRRCKCPPLNYISTIFSGVLIDHPQYIDLDRLECTQSSDPSPTDAYVPSITVIDQSIAKGELNVKSFLAYGDGRTVSDGVTNVTTFTSATANFTQNDVNKYAIFHKEANSVFWSTTTITAVTNSTTATISGALAANVTGATVMIGHTDQGAFINCGANAAAAGLSVRIPPGTYLMPGGTLSANTTYKFEPGASMMVTGASNIGTTVIFNGIIDAPPTQQIFTGHVGSDSVVTAAHWNLVNVSSSQPFVSLNWYPAAIGAILSSEGANVPIYQTAQQRVIAKTRSSFANGSNDNVTFPATGYAEVYGPAASYSLTGIAPPSNYGTNYDGMECEMWFLPNQQLTIGHLRTSTVGNQIACPTAADIVLGAPGSGGFHYAKFRYCYQPNNTPSLAAWLLVDYE